MSLDPSQAPQFLDRMLAQRKIVVISATYCTFCSKLKLLLIELKQTFITLEIDVIPNGREVFAEVALRTGVHTVPQVFLQGKYLGGYDVIIGLFKKNELLAVLERGSL